MKEYKISLNDLDKKTKDLTVPFQKLFEETKDETEEILISLEKGEYHFYKDFAYRGVIHTSNTDSHLYPEKSAAVFLKKRKNITLDGNGSLFIMHGDMIPFVLEKCENITLKNFSWDFPCATTFELQTLSKSTFSAEFKIAPSFEFEIDGKHLKSFERSPITGEKYWENTDQKDMHSVVGHDLNTNCVMRLPLSHGPLQSVRSIKKLPGNIIKVSYFKPTSKEIKKDMVFELCTSCRRDCVGSLAAESKNIKLENINIHYMHGFGLLVQMSEDVTFESCNFVPRKGTERHTTSFADLIHVSGAKGKIKINNCTFCNAHDDPINIHGTYTRVKKKLGEKTLLLEYVHAQQNGFAQFHKGDKVVFYARDNFAPLENEREFTVAEAFNPLENGNGIKEMTVTFEEKLPDCIDDKLGSEKLYVAENVTFTPEVYIGNCNFSAIPTRGILCTTRKKVLIEKNTFDFMTMASIYLSNDCNDWYESGPIRDFTIRDNTFFVRKPYAKYGWCKAAIFIDPIVKSLKNSNLAVHENILIEGNTFYMEHENVLNAKCTKNLVFKNNKIKTLPNAEKPIKAFNLSNCTDVVIQNNEVENGIDMSN